MIIEPFADFTHVIKSRLGQSLPGENAQLKMASGSRLIANARVNVRTRQSAVLILMYPKSGSISIPLILRPIYDGVHSGQMAFPGGRYETFDKTLVRTALREAQEEIGLRLNDVEILGELSQVYIPPSNMIVQPVVASLPYVPEFYPDAREVADIIEITLDEIMDPSIISSTEMEVKGLRFSTPFYQIKNQKVWGATAMMISELIDVIQQP